MNKYLLFGIKVCITVLFTFLFNMFLSNNFDVSLFEQWFWSFTFSSIFYNLISIEVKLFTEIKELF